MLDDQIKEIFAYKKSTEINKSMNASNSQPPKENFIPYKNSILPIKKTQESKSHRNNNLEIAAEKSRKDRLRVSDKGSARVTYSKIQGVYTPRYNQRNVRLVKSKQQFIQHQDHIDNYNARSRQQRVNFSLDWLAIIAVIYPYFSISNL